MLDTACWHWFPALPPLAWAQSSSKHAEGSVKTCTFIPSQCLTRGRHCSGTWQQTPVKKKQTREEP